MDRLARNAMLARQAGMSYGKWKALQPVVPIEKVERPLPEGWKTCEQCGKEFFSLRKAQRFCELGCRNEAYAERNRELAKQSYKRRKERMKQSAAEE